MIMDLPTFCNISTQRLRSWMRPLLRSSFLLKFQRKRPHSVLMPWLFTPTKLQHSVTSVEKCCLVWWGKDSNVKVRKFWVLNCVRQGDWNVLDLHGMGEENGKCTECFVENVLESDNVKYWFFLCWPIDCQNFIWYVTVCYTVCPALCSIINSSMQIFILWSSGLLYPVLIYYM